MLCNIRSIWSSNLEKTVKNLIFGSFLHKLCWLCIINDPSWHLDHCRQLLIYFFYKNMQYQTAWINPTSLNDLKTWFHCFCRKFSKSRAGLGHIGQKIFFCKILRIEGFWVRKCHKKPYFENLVNGSFKSAVLVILAIFRPRYLEKKNFPGRAVFAGC